MFKYLEEELLQHADYMAIFHTLRSQVDKLNDVRKLTQVSEKEGVNDIQTANLPVCVNIWQFKLEALPSLQ